MMHVSGLAAAVLWFGLNGLLWYAKPPELLWLLGSAVLGLAYFAGFFWYLHVADGDHRPQKKSSR
jgi:quinol-cytochrome oxidoreductase complex cytochrome b subunit